jgi:hypothetical protein
LYCPRELTIEFLKTLSVLLSKIKNSKELNVDPQPLFLSKFKFLEITVLKFGNTPDLTEIVFAFSRYDALLLKIIPTFTSFKY